jgi:hypothetical protein
VTRFVAEITDLPPSLGFDLPFDPEEVLGKTRAPVRVTINGHDFRTTVAAMRGRIFIGLNKGVQHATRVSPGDRVEVELELDDEPRTVDVPPDLAAALDAETRAYFDALSYTHRKEYVRWIEEAKREETRQSRVTRAVEMLRDRVRHP